ncbi:MAG: hypothetical protein QXT53_06300 [Ignisphaera sp.]
MLSNNNIIGRRVIMFKRAECKSMNTTSIFKVVAEVVKSLSLREIFESISMNLYQDSS